MGQQLFSDHIKCGTTLFCQHSPQAILSISFAHVLLLLFGNAFGVGSLRKKITSKERCIFISSLPFGLRGPHRIQGTSDKWQGNHAAFLLTFLCGTRTLSLCHFMDYQLQDLDNTEHSFNEGVRRQRSPLSWSLACLSNNVRSYITFLYP